MPKNTSSTTSERNVKMAIDSICLLVCTMSEGKIEELIKHKRTFLKQTTNEYSTGGNDMLDDIDAALKEAKAEIAHNLELVNCLRKDEGEQAWQKDCLSMFNAWYEKWFGTP
jgi:hypothetical protein